MAGEHADIGSAVRPPQAGTVLIADRDAGRRAELATVVSHFDPRAVIVQTASGEALIDLALAHKPALAFVGLQLEGVSGPEAVAVARKRGATLPCLVLIAARVFAQWQELAVSLGAYEVLKVPLDTAHIESLLHADTRRRQPTRILLASSSDAARAAIGRVLARSGFALEIDETDCGRHALKLLKTDAYPLAFVDVKLNGTDGLELACQVQTLNLTTRLTMLTSGDPEPIAQAARYFGATFVLKMPFHARDIDLTLHHALGLRRPYLLNAITAPPAPTALLRIAALAPARRSA
ncbi:response regulator [Methylobacterium sp. E-041]|uniref:response regulator n=1 Tax=unclassified Methylobacterium TaxID=2615210 RepID=UPI001FB86550|nr:MULTISPECIES: response regulator [unclassified Methylobacterium]MCJ2038360.1 response regulator [Methylobacterium sp. J-059]MCJ2078521.1 response regulator [Methylobacterium sp. E-016]MCJ2108866.1 response regulator [Methylobacterium sp. E-041]